MASILPIFLVLVVVVALMTASALFVPKGLDQVSVPASIGDDGGD